MTQLPSGLQQTLVANPTEVAEEAVTVCHLRSISQLSIEVGVNDLTVEAVVDTAAEVTILSDRVFDKLRNKPQVLQEVKLLTAGRQMSMMGKIVGPFDVKIGDKWYSETLYVAPIEQDMLLGFDILERGKSILNMSGHIIFDGQPIVMKVSNRTKSPSVAKVTVAQRKLVRPKSAVYIKCLLSDKMEECYVEPQQDLSVLVPRTLCNGGTTVTVSAVNTSNRFRLLRKGLELGKAYPISEVAHIYPSDKSEREVRQMTLEKVAIIPDHVRDLLERSSEHLQEDEQSKLADLLSSYNDVFAKHEYDLGNFTAIKHKIDTGDAKPIKQGLRRTPAHFAGEEEAHLNKMQEAGVIQESTSDWASAPVLIRKKDGTVRWCIDYRGLNNVTVKDVFPLPLVDDCLDTLSGNIWFSKLDANSAYWQVEIEEEDRKKTAFHTKYGLFEHVKMGFGLCNAPATFARVMNLVLRGLNWKIALAFLDDILVMGKSFEDHLVNLGETLGRFREYGLKLKPKKCVLFQKEVEFLGRQVSSNTLAMSRADTRVVEDWPEPKNSKDVERFMGLANYHRTFVKDFSKKAEPLYKVTGKQEFQWEEEQQSAFKTLKHDLTHPPILALPNNTDPFILDTDASENAIGAVLSQVQNGEEKVIAYGSFALTKEQRRYCVTRKELLAIVRFTRQYRYYLLGKPFVVRTDHSSLTWLLRFKEPQGQLARWIEELSQYNMILKHRPGRRHGNADALSRIPVSEGESSACAALRRLGDLPCGGCAYCRRVDSQWGSFAREVDDVVPLVAQTASVLEQNPCVNLTESRRQVSASRLSERSNGDANRNVPEFENGKTAQTSDSSKEVSETHRSIIPDFGDLIYPWEDDRPSPRIRITLTSPEPVVECNNVSTDKTSGILTNHTWGFSNVDLKQAQEKDESLRLILEWVKSQKEPTEKELFIASPAAKSYWLNKELFLLIDGVLFRKKDELDDVVLIVPKKLQTDAIELCHNVPLAGHQGIARTKLKVQERFFWHNMNSAIGTHVIQCEVCELNKKNCRQGRQGMQEYQAGAPMERVHIDFLGPLPKTHRDNEYILVMVDQFTKWVECVPLPNQTAEVTAKAAVDQFFSRFGCPFQVFSDQGRNFESKLFQALCDTLQIHKARTTPYRPSANGQVERFNRTLMDAIRCYVDESQDNWDLYLQQITGAIRSSVNRSTGYTPNMLMLGREINLPADLMFPQAILKACDEDDYVSKLTSRIQTAHDTARTKLQSNLERMKRDYDVRILTRNYDEGDIVYLLDSATVKGKCKKLSSPWKGPGLIVKKISASLFRIKLKNAILVVNHDRMKPCKTQKLPAWILNWKPDTNQGGAGEDDDKKEYCLCRKPWQGRFMIQCDQCDEWYHGSCVNVTASEALDIDTYEYVGCKASR